MRDCRSCNNSLGVRSVLVFMNEDWGGKLVTFDWQRTPLASNAGFPSTAPRQGTNHTRQASSLSRERRLHKRNQPVRRATRITAPNRTNSNDLIWCRPPSWVGE